MPVVTVTVSQPTPEVKQQASDALKVKTGTRAGTPSWGA